MKGLRIKQLIDLVEANIDGGESRIEKIFEWRFEREITAARWSLGLAASLAVAVVIAYFRDAGNLVDAALPKSSGLEFAITLALAFVSMTYGLFLMWRLRSLHNEYVAALTIFGRLNRIRKFVQRYRRDA